VHRFNLHRLTQSNHGTVTTALQRRKLKLKANVESGSSQFSFKH